MRKPGDDEDPPRKVDTATWCGGQGASTPPGINGARGEKHET